MSLFVHSAYADISDTSEIFAVDTRGTSGGSMGYSDPFTVDTRNTGTSQLAVSNLFTVDLPLYSTGPWGMSNGYEIDTIPAWGAGDSSSSAASFVLDTQNGLDVGDFYIDGPTSIASSETGTYRMYLRNPSSGKISDVSAYSRLRLEGGAHPNAGIGGRTVFAYNVSTSTQITLYATYQRMDGQVTSSPFAVLLTTPNLKLSAKSVRTPVGDSYQISLTAEASGGAGGYTYAWDTDGDGEYDDAFAATTNLTRSEPGTYTFSVQATDTANRSATASTSIVINHALSNHQPEREAEAITYDPPSVIGAGQLYDYDGFPLTSPVTRFDPTKKTNGLIIIAHGMNEEFDGSTNWWPIQMARAIKARYEYLGKLDEMPNIVIYDWTEGATPSQPDGLFLQALIEESEKHLSYLSKAWAVLKNGFTETLSAEFVLLGLKQTEYGETISLLLKLTSPIDFTTAYGVKITQLMVDAINIRPIALNYGSALGAWVQLNAGNGESIDPDAPIHLIGHSAGGFVVGETALSLYQQWGITVDRVTMLDTPMPWLPHCSVLPEPIYVERIVSSILGVSEDRNITKIPFSEYYRYYFTDDYNSSIQDVLDAHRYAYQWYEETILTLEAADNPRGFALSPFTEGPHAEKSRATVSSFSVASSSDPWTEFSAFGNVSGVGEERTLTEDHDTGLWQETALPVGASTLEFEAKFNNDSDGDFLAVTFNNHLLRTIANIPSATGIYRKYTLPIANLAGETGTLVFNLISRGEPNAVITLKNFAIIIDDDIDGDGILNDDELIAGTDPHSIDTDSDGLPDGEEIPSSNPLLADTDGDGSNDLSERIAGTLASDADSVFRITQTEGNQNTVKIWWDSIPGKSYRVLWSDTPGFESFQVIAQAVQSTADKSSYTDTQKTPSITGQSFYRVEVTSP
jgi:hypothetical protein